MKLIGYQIVHRETDNPPWGVGTYEVYPLDVCLGFLESHQERGLWRLLPVYEGDVEEPEFPYGEN